MSTRDQIVEEARKWIGTPWRHLGRNRAGIDCVGLGVVVTRALNICDYDVASYSRTPGPGLTDHIRKVADEVIITLAEPGDFLVLRDAAFPFHVAFLSMRHGQFHIIHAHARRRMVIEEPYIGDWPKLTLHAFRFNGVA